MKNPMQMRQIAIDRTPVERQLRRRLHYAPIGKCLTFEQFLELAKRGRRAAGYYEQMSHIISCSACRRAYLELRVILHAQRPSLARWLSRLTTPRLPQWALATGFAGVVFAFAVWALYPKPGNNTLIAVNPPAQKRDQIAQLPPSSPPAEPREPERREPEPRRPERREPEPRRPERREPEPRHPERREPEPRHPERREPQQQLLPLQREWASVGRFVSQGAESLSRTLASLAQGRAVRGEQGVRGVQQITVLQPDLSESDLLEDTTVTLQWESVEGATKYIVVLRRSDTGETILEEELPETLTHFQLRSLAPGGEYALTLRAPRGERRTLKTEIPFQVMSEAQRADLRWARQNASEAPLVAGLLFYQLKRYREAIGALERAQQLYPDNEDIKRALNNLRARPRR